MIVVDTPYVTDSFGPSRKILDNIERLNRETKLKLINH